MIYEFGQTIQKNLEDLMNSSNSKQIDNIVNEIIRNLVTENINMNQIILLKGKIDNLIKQKDFSNQKNMKSYLNETKKQIHGIIYNHLIEIMKPNETAFEPISGKQNIVMFVGLQGAGKTTSICKYAYHYRKKGLKVGIICADTFRSGAFDQIKQNASKINAPFYGSDEEKNAIKIAKEGVKFFSDKFFDLILIDTSGRHTHNEELFKDMREMVKEISPHEIVFVMDAGIGVAAEEQAKGFKESVKLGSIILTKMDGAEKSGGALSAVAVSGCPVSFVGMGEDMNDLEKFDASRFVGKILGLGDLETLAERIEECEVDKDVNILELTKNLASGNLSISDYKKTFKIMKKLGPMEALMKFIPGMSKVNNKIDGDTIRMSEAIMDSMTAKELKTDGSGILNSASKRKRISMGAGVTEKKLVETIEYMRATNEFFSSSKKFKMFEDFLNGNMDDTGFSSSLSNLSNMFSFDKK